MKITYEISDRVIAQPYYQYGMIGHVVEVNATVIKVYFNELGKTFEFVENELEPSIETQRHELDEYKRLIKMYKDKLSEIYEIVSCLG